MTSQICHNNAFWFDNYRYEACSPSSTTDLSLNMDPKNICHRLSLMSLQNTSAAGHLSPPIPTAWKDEAVSILTYYNIQIMFVAAALTMSTDRSTLISPKFTSIRRPCTGTIVLNVTGTNYMPSCEIMPCTKKHLLLLWNAIHSILLLSLVVPFSCVVVYSLLSLRSVILVVYYLFFIFPFLILLMHTLSLSLLWYILYTNGIYT